ncbi:MAG: radical SAM protein [Chloroflexi bacterium]|nr:radical SAM protein [Chloroflexota bacterium]MBU1746189.1 radical SAM protein [Chloroflexota bacterium]MBU1877719.1 radical SAM protein [Chloroflexota bacterium]
MKRRVDQVALWQDKKPLLGRLDMELTERCNNNCIHCCINLPAGDRAARERELSAEEVKAILAEAAALGAMQVRFTGGEPLLRPDFEELYLFARRLGMRVLIFTNARLITPHLADLLARVPPLVTMEVTVYGMRAESYEAVSRVTGSFAQFWRGVNLLLERGVPFVVKSALLPPNRGEIDEFEDWAATIPWMDKGPSYAMFLHLRNRRDSEERNQLIKRLRLSPAEGLAVLTRDREGYRKGMRKFCSRFMGPPGDRLFSCGAGHGTCIDAYGQAQMCMGLRHPDTVVDLWGGVGADRDVLIARVCPDDPRQGDHTGAPLRYALTEFFPRLRELRAANPEYLHRCARCFLKGLCEQCPAKSWAEHGTLDTPVEYLCQVAHAQARELGLLGQDEHGWEVMDWRQRIARFVEPEM